MTTVASLKAVVSADISGFERGINKVQSDLKNTASESRKTGEAAGGVGEAFTKAGAEGEAGTGRMAGGVAGVHSAIGKMMAAGVIQQVGQTISTAGRSIGEVFLGAAKSAGNFDQALRNVDSIAHLNQAGFKDLHDSILKVANDPAIRQMPTDLAAGMYDVYSSGFAGAKALDILKASAKGASAGMTDTATSSRALMAVLNSGIGGVKNASQAMDVMFQEVNLGVNSFGELAQHIGTVLPSAKQLGINLQEVTAALAVTTRHGIDMAESTTAIDEMLRHIKSPTAEAVKVMDQLGVSYGSTAVKGGDLLGYLDNLSQKAAAFAALHKTLTVGNTEFKISNGSDVMNRVFSEARSARAATILTDGGGKDFSAMLKGMQGAQGQTTEALNRQNKGANAQMELFQKNVQLLSVSLGEFLLPSLVKIVGGVNSMVEAFRALPAPTQQFIAIGGAIAAAIAVIAGGMISAVGAVGGAAAALAAMGVTAGGAAAALGALALPVAAVALAVAGLVLAWKTDFGGIQETTAKVGAAVKGFIDSQFGYVVKWFTANMPLIRETVHTVLTTIEQFWHDHGSRIMAIIGPLWDFIKTLFSAALHIILDVVKLGMDVLTGHWGAAAKDIGGIVTNLWAVVRSLFTNGVKMIGNTLALAVSLFFDLEKRWYTAGLNLGTQIIQGLIGGIKSGISSVENAITGMATSAVTAAKTALDIHSPSKKMHEIGQWSAQGLADGLRDGTITVSQAADALGEGVHKHVKAKLTEAQKEMHTYALEMAREMATLAALRSGKDPAAASALGQFHDVPGAAALASIKDQIAHIKTAEAAQRAFNAEMSKTKSQIADLMAGGNKRDVQAAHRFNTIPQSQRDGLGEMKTILDGMKKAAAGGMDDTNPFAAMAKSIAKEAAVAVPKVKALAKVIQDFNAEIVARVSSAKQVISGNTDPTAKQWQDYLSNHGALALEISKDAGLAATEFSKFKTALETEQQAQGLTRVRDMLSDIARTTAEIQAKNPFEAFKISQSVADGLGGIKAQPGVTDAQLKQVFDAQILQARAQQAQQVIGTFVGGLRDTVQGSLDGLFQNGFQGFFTNVVTGFQKMFQNIAEQMLVNEAMMALLGALGGTNLQSQFGLGSLGGARATGGPVFGGQTYLVGENGPELFKAPGSGGSIVPNNQLGGGNGSGGDTHIHVTVQSSGGNTAQDRRSGQQIAHAMLEEMQRAQRRNG